MNEEARFSIGDAVAEPEGPAVLGWWPLLVNGWPIAYFRDEREASATADILNAFEPHRNRVAIRMIRKALEGRP